jgi:hypothetical protein
MATRDFRTVPPAERDLGEHMLAITCPIETVLGLVEGAMKFQPSPLVVSESDQPEVLSDRGRRFVGIVLEYLVEAQEGASGASGHVTGLDPELQNFDSLAFEIQLSMEVCVLIAHAMLSEDVPSSAASAQTGLEEIERRLKAAEEIGKQLALIDHRRMLLVKPKPSPPPVEAPKKATPPAAGSSTDAGPSNAFLRFEKEGDDYREWELLLDVPVIPTSERFNVTPRHAVAGDILREEDDDQDELTPFKLYRKVEGRWKRIGNPERWQVRHLFEGMSPADAGAGAPAPDPDLTRLRAVADVIKANMGAYVATADLPGTPIREGDFVLHGWADIPKRFLKHIFGHWSRIPRSSFPSILESFDALRYLDGPPYRASGAGDLHRAISGTRSRGKSPSPLFLVRSRSSSVSAPIAAKDDAEAVFELLYQVSRGEEPGHA